MILTELSADTQARFWAKVDRRDDASCWFWTATVGEHGYGRFGVHRRLYSAHRLAWTTVHGVIPVGRLLLHSCDTPACVNPSHMFLGTQSDNMLDMYRKGRGGDRGLRGSANPRARLTDAQVAEARSLYATQQYTQGQIAQRFGVRRATIGYLVTGKTWTR